MIKCKLTYLNHNNFSFVSNILYIFLKSSLKSSQISYFATKKQLKFNSSYQSVINIDPHGKYCLYLAHMQDSILFCISLISSLFIYISSYYSCDNNMIWQSKSFLICFSPRKEKTAHFALLIRIRVRVSIQLMGSGAIDQQSNYHFSSFYLKYKLGTFIHPFNLLNI